MHIENLVRKAMQSEITKRIENFTFNHEKEKNICIKQRCPQTGRIHLF